jgi:hypothetical protein
MKIPIRLEGAYEVALTEVCLPFNWSAVVDGGIIVTNYETNIETNIRLNWFIDQSINEIVDYLNKSLTQKKLPLVFSYDMQNYLFSLYIPNNFAIRFNSNTGRELGFNFTIAEESTKMTHFKPHHPVPPHVNKISSLYLYTDIIEHQFVGDTFAPLLRTIAVPNISQDQI